MKKIYPLIFCFTSLFCGAQVGIGTTTPQGALEVMSTNTGFLPPRVALTITTSSVPVVNPVGGAPAVGTMVFNTSTSADVTPGYYYWSGSAWIRMAASTVRNWQLAGNASTVPGTDFLGTTDNQELRIKTNNADRFSFTNNGRLRSYDNGTAGLPTFSWIGDENTGLWRPAADILGLSTNGVERLRVNTDGRVSVNNTAPVANDLFTATTSGAINYAVNGYNNLATGSAIYGTNSNTTTTYSGIEGTTNGSSGGGVFGISYGATGGTGVIGQFSGGTTGQRNGVMGNSNRGAGNQQFGLYGLYNGAGYGAGLMAVGFGGGIPGGNLDFAVVGWSGNNFNYSGYFNGNHVIANGTKSASVGTSKGNQLLYVTETPEVWFEDIGRGTLVNGTAIIKLDPLFLETVHIDDQHKMSVFLQEEGESNGLYVIPGSDGFTVREKSGGTSNISFSYRIMAKRKHFQDHRFGNDPVWGAGDTRSYSQYAPPPPVDYQENVAFQQKQKAEFKPTPLPPGFKDYPTLFREAQSAYRQKD